MMDTSFSPEKNPALDYFHRDLLDALPVNKLEGRNVEFYRQPYHVGEYTLETLKLAQIKDKISFIVKQAEGPNGIKPKTRLTEDIQASYQDLAIQLAHRCSVMSTMLNVHGRGENRARTVHSIQRSKQLIDQAYSETMTNLEAKTRGIAKQAKKIFDQERKGFEDIYRDLDLLTNQLTLNDSSSRRVLTDPATQSPQFWAKYGPKRSQSCLTAIKHDLVNLTYKPELTRYPSYKSKILPVIEDLLNQIEKLVNQDFGTLQKINQFEKQLGEVLIPLLSALVFPGETTTRQGQAITFSQDVIKTVNMHSQIDYYMDCLTTGIQATKYGMLYNQELLPVEHAKELMEAVSLANGTLLEVDSIFNDDRTRASSPSKENLFFNILVKSCKDELNSIHPALDRLSVINSDRDISDEQVEVNIPFISRLYVSTEIVDQRVADAQTKMSNHFQKAFDIVSSMYEKGSITKAEHDSFCERFNALYILVQTPLTASRMLLEELREKKKHLNQSMEQASQATPVRKEKPKKGRGTRSVGSAAQNRSQPRAKNKKKQATPLNQPKKEEEKEPKTKTPSPCPQRAIHPEGWTPKDRKREQLENLEPAERSRNLLQQGITEEVMEDIDLYLTGNELKQHKFVKRIEKLGWRLVRTTGGHQIYGDRKGNTVPVPTGELRRGTAGNILRKIQESGNQ